MITHLIQEIKDAFEEILPSHIRVKRGLLNVLGSAIKVITGNMDASDAKNIHQKILRLEKNQEKIVLSEKETISLTAKSINKFNRTIRGIIHNQQTIEEKVNDIIIYLKQNGHNKIDYYEITDVLFQIINSLNEILRILTNLQTAISFAKVKLMHSNIITPHELLEELHGIKNEILPYEFPIDLNIHNVPTLENLVEVKAYSATNKIIFLLQIPLVNQNTFRFIQIFSLPVHISSDIFQIIIPTYNKLLISEQFYADPKNCKNIQQNEYLCEHGNLLPINDRSPCIIQIINAQRNLTSCQPERFHLQKDIVMKINENSFIVVFTEETKIQKICNKDLSNQILHGTFVISTFQDCYIQFNKIKLTSSKNSNNTRIKLIVTPHSKFEINIKNNTELLPISNLENIPLNQNQDVKRSLTKIYNDLSKKQEEFEGPDIWTIISYIIIFIIFIFVGYRLYRKRQATKREAHTPEEPKASGVNLP